MTCQKLIGVKGTSFFIGDKELNESGITYNILRGRPRMGPHRAGQVGVVGMIKNETLALQRALNGSGMAYLVPC
jgi:hypothetical protein